MKIKVVGTQREREKVKHDVKWKKRKGGTCREWA